MSWLSPTLATRMGDASHQQYPLAVCPAGQTVEVVGAGAEQADRAGEAGQGDDGGQDQLAVVAEQAQNIGVDDGAAIVDVGHHARCTVAQVEQEM